LRFRVGLLTHTRITQRLLYLNSQCATCDAPLDNSEQVLGFEDPEVYCTSNREAGHLSVGCLECNEKFPSLRDFKNSIHGPWESHHSFRCAVPDCSAKVHPWQITAHYRDRHPNEQYRCAQCTLEFKTHNELDQHGGETMHAAYRCCYPECGSECTTIANLKRHQLTHRSILQRYACPHCRK
jgi:general transcription factor IIIA